MGLASILESEMFKVNVDDADIKRLQKDLKKVTGRQGRAAVTRANAAGIIHIKKAIKQRAPVKTGTLKKGIRHKKSRSRPGLVVHRILFPYYAHFIERGFDHKGGQHIARKPFIIPAYDQSKKQTSEIVIKRIKLELDKIFK